MHSEPRAGNVRRVSSYWRLIFSIVTDQESSSLAVNARLPLDLLDSDFVGDGGLMTYGANTPDLFRRAATYVDIDSQRYEARRFTGRAANEV